MNRKTAAVVVLVVIASAVLILRIRSADNTDSIPRQHAPPDKHAAPRTETNSAPSELTASEALQITAMPETKSPSAHAHHESPDSKPAAPLPALSQKSTMPSEMKAKLQTVFQFIAEQIAKIQLKYERGEDGTYQVSLFDVPEEIRWAIKDLKNALSGSF
jgi:hypothetical protein